MADSVSLAEAAQQLHISTRTARRWIRAGTLPAELGPGRNGPQYRVPMQAVTAIQEARAVRAAPYHAADAESMRDTVSDTWRQLTVSQQELWRATMELTRTMHEMHRLREELAETRLLLSAERESRSRADANQ